MTFEIKKGEIWHRDDFGLLCFWRVLRRCVEIGVDRGEFSQTFLMRNVACEFFVGVDPYIDYVGTGERQGDYDIALLRYERFGRLAKLIKLKSADAATAFASHDASNFHRLWDFVYLDGDHSYEGVKRDIDSWWPLLSNKGVLAGHDWSVPTGEWPGVQQAVTELAEKNELTIFHTYADPPTSWYIYKNGIPGPDFERRPDL